VLSQYLEKISDFYKRTIEVARNDISGQMAAALERVDIADRTIKMCKKNLKTIENLEIKLADKLKDAKTSTDKLSELNNQLMDIGSRKQNLLNDISSYRRSLDISKIEVESLKNSMASVSNIKLIQEPRVSAVPAEPNMKKNVFFAGVLSLMAGLLVSLSMELWQRGNTIKRKNHN
jgi:uncharacterized protein involved in exopolysaccharide biosynthesis